MKQLRLTNEDIALVCRTLAQMCHAGIAHGDAFALMAEDESGGLYGQMFARMARRADKGLPLSAVFREEACFPDYLCALLEVSERVGKTEESLEALADYYEGRAGLAQRMKAALLYPAVLLAVLFAVVFILLVWVLPVFGDVYARLGSQTEGLAAGLMSLGAVLRRLLPVICVLLGAAVAAAAVLWVFPALRVGLMEKLSRSRSDKGIGRAVNTARFAQALALGLGSGMREDEAAAMAADLAGSGAAFRKRCESCVALVEKGESLASALRETEILRSADCRLLEAGCRSGSADKVMAVLAARLLEESERTLEEKAGRIEPALVVVLAVVVGAILLSVMLPLINIMNAIG